MLLVQDRERKYIQKEHYKKHYEEEEEDTPLRLYYYEILLRSNKSKAFIDFEDSYRNTTIDADITSSYTPEQAITQLKIYNDNTADYIRFSINEGVNSGPNIKLKFGESVTIPFIEVSRHKKIKSLTVQAVTSNATVRVIGII